MRHLKKYPLLILPLLGALVVGTAFAADKPVSAGSAGKAAKKEGNFGAGKASGAYLTREQLRSCLTRRDNMRIDDAELQQDEGSMAARKAEIVTRGDALKAGLEGLDRTNAEVVTAYNDAVAARDKEIEDFQTRATAFNARVDAKVATHAEFEQSCSNRRYFDEDEIAIRNAR